MIANSAPFINIKDLLQQGELPLQTTSLHAVKNSIIEDHGGRPLDPISFLWRLYGTEPIEPLVYVIAEESTYRTVNDAEELLEMARFRSDVYLPPCLFFRGRYSTATTRQHLAMVIDLDGLTPWELRQIMQRINSRKMIRPTWIVNSGGGIHLYYVFTTPVEAYHKRRKDITDLKRALTKHVKQQGTGEVTMLSPIQSHRLPGSRTKHGEEVTVFAYGDEWEIEALADAAKHRLSDAFTAKPSESQDGKKIRKVLHLPRKNENWWRSTLARVFGDRIAMAGRQNALFALAIIGYKCGQSREEVLRETLLIAEGFNERRHMQGLPPIDIERECKKWMNGYNQKYIRTTGRRLAELLGWAWDGRKSKRNGRSQKAHLTIARASRNARVSVDKAEAIRKYRAENPTASQRQCVAALKMSFSTVSKYWKTGE